MISSRGSRKCDEHGTLHAFVRDVLKQNGECLLLSVDERRDETPMNVVTVDDECLLGLFGEVAEAVQEIGAESKMPAAARTRAPSKLLQTEMAITALAKLGTRYISLVLPLLIPIQDMGRTTAEVYFRAIQVILNIIEFKVLMQHFRRSQIVSCSDGASAIERNRRALAAHYPGISVWKEICRMHKVTQVFLWMHWLRFSAE